LVAKKESDHTFPPLYRLWRFEWWYKILSGPHRIKFSIPYGFQLYDFMIFTFSMISQKRLVEKKSDHTYPHYIDHDVLNGAIRFCRDLTISNFRFLMVFNPIISWFSPFRWNIKNGWSQKNMITPTTTISIMTFWIVVSDFVGTISNFRFLMVFNPMMSWFSHFRWYIKNICRKHLDFTVSNFRSLMVFNLMISLCSPFRWYLKNG
jgi:hypothetical protein